MAHLILALVPIWCGAHLLLAEPPGQNFFTHPDVHPFEIQLSPKSLAGLRAMPREYVTGTVRVDGVTYTNVGIHLKGVATFRPVDDQPSLTLNFGKFVDKQRFHGLRKIHLNNGKEDPTFLCEAISAEMFAAAGLPVARVTHARTRLNGRDLGPYVAIEGFTAEFLARYFHNTRGNLYDSGFTRDVTQPLERLSGKAPDDWADLKALAAAARAPDLDQRWQQLVRVLDTNNFSRYLAMQVLTANWDGYALYKNNYRIYHDPESDRLFFIPHGMDQMFTPSHILMPLMPPHWVGLVARAFMETPQGRALYEQQIGLLYTNVYHAEALARRVDELAARVRPILAERNEVAGQQYEQEAEELRERIKLRGHLIRQQLATTNWMNPTVPGRPGYRPLRTLRDL